MVTGTAPMDVRARVADEIGRTFRSVRLSVTPGCNMTCAYCDPAGLFTRGLKDFSPPEFYTGIIERIQSAADIQEVRITGGEPTLYPHLIELVHNLRSRGIPRISLTTNGLCLSPVAASLKEAGLSDLNVSVDSLDHGRYATITGSTRLDRVLAGIDAVLSAEIPVKVNATILRNANTEDIVPLLEYFGDRSVPVRFLEVMKMGPIRDTHESLLFREEEILGEIRKRWTFRDLPRALSATARYRKTDDGRIFGVIANHSEPFCSDCDRMRIDHKGRIYGCLSSFRSITLPDDPSHTREVLAHALAEKTRTFTGSEIHMREIGG